MISQLLCREYAVLNKYHSSYWRKKLWWNIFISGNAVFVKKKSSNCTRRCWLWWNFALRKKHTHTHQNWNILKHISNVQIIYFKKWSIRSFFSFQNKPQQKPTTDSVLLLLLEVGWGDEREESGCRKGGEKEKKKCRKKTKQKPKQNTILPVFLYWKSSMWNVKIWQQFWYITNL